jgi:hypothetical protein
MMDGTPIYDIKPYIPYSDRINAKLLALRLNLMYASCMSSYVSRQLKKIPADKAGISQRSTGNGSPSAVSE